MKMLNTAAHFNKAMLNNWHILVYQEDELIDNGGRIDKQTKDTVIINGSHFIKANCQFLVKDKL